MRKKKEKAEKDQLTRKELQRALLMPTLIKVAVFVLAAVLIWFGASYILNKIKGNNIVGDTLKKAGDKVNSVIVGKDGKVTTISESSLEKVFEISELSTATYTYNAIARIYDAKGQKVDYYVAYDGTVVVGIDFNKITFYIAEDEKKIYIKIPACEILETTVDFGSMEYIFINDSVKSETISASAYQACEEDLNARVANDEQLIEMARENTIDTVTALVEPWVKQLDGDYTVKIQMNE